MARRGSSVTWGDALGQVNVIKGAVYANNGIDPVGNGPGEVVRMGSWWANDKNEHEVDEKHLSLRIKVKVRAE